MRKFEFFSKLKFWIISVSTSIFHVWTVAETSKSGILTLIESR